MALQKRHLAIIHIAAKELGLDDEAYRKVLQTQAGVRSAKHLNHRGFRAVMKHFETRGFQPRSAARRPMPSNRARMATAGQIKKIYAQWATLEGCWYETGSFWKTLRGFLQKRFRVKHEKFLTLEKAGQVIEALKSIGSRIMHNGKCMVKK
ncbi:MAG: regulatory protein GemA [Desulfobacterales bacterium]|nr:MAG: regulatory protein GemA [Desulfobacterales bacterium]